jgi:glucose/arabinose dehydrogenase
MRPVVFAATVSIAALAMACDANGQNGQAAPAGQSLETRAANAPTQQPAFAGQTRAPGVTTQAAPEVTVVAEGLEHPWALVQMPDGRWLVTERPGRLRVIGADGAVSDPVAGLPPVVSGGQAGLLDVALSPGFADDRLIYWSYSEPREGGSATSVARGRLSDDAARVDQVQVIFRATPVVDNMMHYGSVLAFDRERRLYVTLGERSSLETRPQAQHMNSHNGKIVRINADGSVPQDNPFVNDGEALSEIWSLGHRNVQGAAIHPETGALWAAEHGARGGDEINVVQAGRNYGWPIAAYGIEYRGGAIGEGASQAEGTEQPIYYFDPVIGTGGIAFYEGAMFPEWRGNLLASGLKDKQLVRLVLDGERVVGEERLMTDQNQRVRDVAVGADGAVYVVTDEDAGRLLRLSAAD